MSSTVVTAVREVVEDTEGGVLEPVVPAPVVTQAPATWPGQAPG